MKSLIFLFCLFPVFSNAQDSTICAQVHGKKDWEKVVILNNDNVLTGIPAVADVMVCFKKARVVASIKDLTEAEIKELKIQAAKWNSCFIYLNEKQFDSKRPNTCIGGGAFRSLR